MIHGSNLDPSKTIFGNAGLANDTNKVNKGYQVDGEPLQRPLVDLAQVPDCPVRANCKFAVLDVALQVHHHGRQLGLNRER